MLKDPIQQPHITTCGPFQIYFYEKLFFSRQGQQNTHLQKTNKRCSGNITERTFCVGPRKQRTNDKRIHNTKTTTNDITHIDCPGSITHLSLSKIGDFGQVKFCVEKITNRDKTTKHFFGKV